jgi:hypothetical protein
MKLLTLNRVVALGAVVVLAACSSSSGGGNPGTGDGGGSSSSSGGEAGTFPSVKISAPATGATGVQVTTQTGSGEKDVLITFTLTGFTLMAPGGCGSVSNTCGHIHVFVDDTTCTPSGSPYNNAIITGTSGNAIMSNCPNTDPINGSHTVRLELHDDQHGAILGANGQQIEDSTQFTATGG